MWIKTNGKIVKAVSVQVVKNSLSRKYKYMLSVMSSAGGFISNTEIVAVFADKQEAREELERICMAIERGDDVYRIADKYCEKLPRMI